MGGGNIMAYRVRIIRDDKAYPVLIPNPKETNNTLNIAQARGLVRELFMYRPPHVVEAYIVNESGERVIQQQQLTTI